jgi:hypothetical protein
MSTSPLLLETRIEPDRRDELIRDLREQNKLLEDACRRAESRVAQASHGAAELRHVLSPLYRALQKIFGELDEAGIGDSNASVSGGSKWDAIKSRNPGRIAQAIDTLLLHGTMNTSQLAAAMKMDRSNCSNNVVTKMKSMGLIVKNGNEFSLRSL